MEQVNNYNLATRYPAMHHSRYTSKQVSAKHKEITRRNMLNMEITPDVMVNLISVITTVLFTVTMGLSIFFFRKKERKTATSLLKVAAFILAIKFVIKFSAKYLETVLNDDLLRTLVLAIIVIVMLGILLFSLRKHIGEE